jgi:hypothetical protein
VPTYVAAGIDGKATVQFAGVNVQIIDGAGSTSTVNGTGNLVLGYDESPGAQSGSHDLILGRNQTYRSYGDILGGYANTASGAYATTFGTGNTASGLESSVTGGSGNTASDTAASVLGGTGNAATNLFASIAGGQNNEATGELASVAGGYGADASGPAASILGGLLNTAQGTESTVGGGNDNVAEGNWTAILGGSENTVNTPACSTFPPTGESC